MFVTTAKNNIMNAVFGGMTGVLPTSLEIGISTTEPLPDGTNISEPDASTGYARVALTAFGASNDGVIANDTAIVFPTFIADAGVASHYVLFREDGTPFWYGALQATRAMEPDTILSFQAGMLQISLEDGV